MSIPAGPNQIAQTYMGNPGALQDNIEKEQQQKAAIMPDFAKLLALGTVTSRKNDAEKAMALQQLAQLQAQSPTGKPPTIFEQIQQKAAQMAGMRNQQAQPRLQGLPGIAPDETETVQAAQGGHIRRGIDHLPANFKFGGGGIVAFQEGGTPPDEYAPSTDLDEVIAKAAQQLNAAEKSGDQKAVDFYTRKIQNLQTYKPKLREAPEKPSLLTAEKAPPLGAYRTITSNAPISGQDLGIMFKDMQSQGLDNVKYTRNPDADLEATAAGMPSAPARVAPVSLPDEKPHPLEADVQKYVKAALAKDPLAEGQAAIKRQQELVGLDQLLAPQQKRISDLETLHKEQAANRPAGWRKWAESFSAANPRMGLGYALGKAGEGYEKARAGYDAEDVANAEKIQTLEAAVIKAKIEGRYKDAAVGEAAIKQILSEQQHAAQSGASLINTREQANARKQQAADALAGRLQQAQIGADARRDAARLAAEQKKADRESKNRQFDERMFLARQKQMQEMEAKWAQILSKDEEYKKLSGMSALAQMRLARAKTPEAMEKLAKEIDSYNIRKLEIQERIIGGRGAVGGSNTEDTAGAKKTIKFNEIK